MSNGDTGSHARGLQAELRLHANQIHAIVSVLNLLP